ncbi:MAG: hypothetical protein WC516_08705 [Patescibacteria group bacterium]|jgi:Zn-dependent protease
MKYIAYYGAWGTSILSLVILGIALAFLVINIHTYYEPLLAMILSYIAIPLLCFISSFSAWIVCDMKKRMKDL